MHKCKFTIIIVLINVLFFTFLSSIGLSFRTFAKYGGLLILQGRLLDWKTLLTYGFVHKSWEHLFYNMFFGGLLMLYIERIIGSKKLAIIYLGSIVGSGLALWVYYSGSTALPIGASGGIFGVMSASGFIFLNQPDTKTKSMVIVLLVLIILGFSVAHIYGSVTGIIIYSIIVFAEKHKQQKLLSG